MPDEAQAKNVVEALSRVMRDLPAIGKDQQASQQQGGYAYRGIEQITKHAQQLLAREGVIFAPDVLSVDVREIEVNGKPWTDTTLRVRYRIYGPAHNRTTFDAIGGGPELRLMDGPIPDFIEVTVVGIGRDNSDKGANKAMTQCFKYALLQVLCISDAKDDADGTTTEADAGSRRVNASRARSDAAPKEPPEGRETGHGNTRRGPRVLDGWADLDAMEAAHARYTERATAAPEEVREAIKVWRTEQGFSWPMTATEMMYADAELTTLIGQADAVASGTEAF